MYTIHIPRVPFLKKYLLFLLLGGISHVGLAQSSTAKKTPPKPAKAVTVKKTPATSTKASVSAAAKPAASNAPAFKRIWRTPQMDEAMHYYTSLNYQKAQQKFKAAAATGDADAYYFMGRMRQYRELKYGNVTVDTLQQIQNAEKYFSANRDSAQYYYQLALDSGSVLGHLGMAELMTLQTKDDVHRFMQHMRTAAIVIRERAVDGDAFCNRILGSMYYTGFGELQDFSLAHNYLRRAAEANDVIAYTSLANLYLNGQGVGKDKEKALYWLKKGVDAHEREAMYTLALLYEEGTLGEVKINDARQLYRKAVAKGSVNAYEQLRYINESPNQKVVLASVNRDPDMLKRAIAAGGDVNTHEVPNEYDANLYARTPLMHALYVPMLLEDYGVVYEPEVRVKTTELLLKAGADVNAQDINGQTALHYVVSSSRIRTELYELEQVQLLEILLKNGANPNIKDKAGNTVLAQALQATIGQHIGIMELEKLLKSGANPNVQNNEGKTPLMLACEIDSNFEIILALLQAGADSKLTDIAGKAAIDFTKHENVQNILLASGSPKKQE